MSALQRYYIPVEVIKEGQQVEGKLDPALALTPRQHVRVHDTGRIVDPQTGHHRSRAVPINVVNNQRNVEQKGEPFAGRQEQHVKH